jgi:hypothetical protein
MHVIVWEGAIKKGRRARDEKWERMREQEMKEEADNVEILTGRYNWSFESSYSLVAKLPYLNCLLQATTPQWYNYSE